MATSRQRAGCRLNRGHFQHSARIAGIGHDRQSAESRDHLAQQFEAFARKIG
jgi:hypothetical protein